MNTMQEVMNKLVASDPVVERDLEGWARSTEGQRMLTGILEASPPVQRMRAPRLPLRSLAAASALLLIVGVVATRTQDAPGGGTSLADPGSAREALQGAALVAARTDDHARPGQWNYRRFEGQGTATREVRGRQITALIPTSIEVWISHDGEHVRVSGNVMEPAFTSADDERWWRAAGSPAFSDVGKFEKVMPAGSVDGDLTTYPTDAEELYAFLAEGSQAPDGGHPDMYVFSTASDLLLNHPEASPKLRSALFEVMSMVRGTELDQRATDPSGRAASAVSLVVDEDGGRTQRHEMYFDREKAEVLGFRDVFTEPDGTETTYAYSVLLASGVVDEAGQKPN